MPEIEPDSATTMGLLERLTSGDRAALEEILRNDRCALREFVNRHLDPRLRQRFDPSDVVQDTQMEITRRIDDFLARRPMPFRLWARKQAYERLLRLRRDHVGRRRRSVIREVAWPDESSMLLARQFVRSSASPGSRAAARDLARRVGQIVGQLPESDRAILLLRHGDDLPYDEIGCLLDIEPATARKRYGRAMIHLQRLLDENGLLE